MPRRGLLWFSLVFYFLIFIEDRFLKYYVECHVVPSCPWDVFYPYGGIGIMQGLFGGIDFSINHVTNRGAAWGVLANVHSVLLIVRCILVFGMVGYLLFFRQSAFKKMALGLIATGALGNIVDDFLYGHVIDMFHFKFWGYSFAVFNIADSAIFVGVVLMMCAPYVQKKWKLA